MTINWYPGHMHKAAKELQHILPKMDLVIEVLDARIPYSSQNPLLAELSADKPRVNLLNKSDLGDPQITGQWLDHFNAQTQQGALAINLYDDDTASRIMRQIEQLVKPNIRKVRTIKAIIMGIPNVGKSTIINQLAKRKVAKTGNEPAVTRAQQAIDCHNGVVLRDTPGLLWPKLYNQRSAYRLAATGAIKQTAIDEIDVAFVAQEYLAKHYADCMLTRFEMDSMPAPGLDFFQQLAAKRGCLGRGGTADLDRVCRLFLAELREGRLGAISFETPSMMATELIEVERLKEAGLQAKEAKQAKKNKRR